MSNNQSYGKHILQMYETAIEKLVNSGISRDIVDYRLKYKAAKYKSPRAPTSAHSNFLINRQVGDWTETLLRTSFDQQFKGFKAIKYGVGGNLVAGDDGFKDMFQHYHAEIKTIGKRPDLLVFDEETVVKLKLPDDISEFDSAPLTVIAKQAIAGLEVRSSKYLASIYRKVKQKEQSFTPKLEDIPILTHWIVEHSVPSFYVQVFFDEVHMISFEKILQIVQETGDKYIDQKERNQMKKTFYLPVTVGMQIGQIVDPPVWKAEQKCTADGRIIPYAIPENGRMELRNDLIRLLEKR
jgi:hypothetical protein